MLPVPQGEVLIEGAANRRRPRQQELDRYLAYLLG